VILQMDWNLNLREIEYIVTIAAEGNITRAAQKLFIAQPSLSQAVKKIEQQIGAKLFIRVKNKIKLTYEGERFVEAGIKCAKIFRDLENEINDIANLNGGRIVVGVPFLLGSFIFPQLDLCYRSRFPGVKIQLLEGTSRELESMILNGLVDLAILPLPIRDPNVEYRTIFTSRMVVQVPNGHRLNQCCYEKPGKTERFRYIDIRIADGESFLLGQEGQRIRQVSELIFQKAHIKPQIAFTSKSISTIQRISATGMGLAIMPEHYIDQLTPIQNVNYYYLEEEYDYQWTIVVAYYKGGYLSSAVQEFLHVLDEVFGENRSPSV